MVGLIGRGVGLALRYRAHRRWMQVIGGETTKRILDIYPRIAFRHSTTYLFEGASWNQRLILLEAHYGFLNRTHDAAFFNAVIGPGGLDLWRPGLSDCDPTISLVGPCIVSRHREGELGLNISIHGVVVYKLAFSVVPLDAVTGAKPCEGSRLGLFVGQVQGSPNCLDLLREASRICQGIAPRDLLMSALLGIAQAWEMDQIMGARADLVLSSNSCSFDYNAFWQQYGGEQTAGKHYAMALPFHEGPIRASSAAHRRRTRRKRQFQAELSAAVAQVVLREGGLPGAASAVAQLKDLNEALHAALRPRVEDPSREAA